jgi:hypothetical protein
LCLFWTNGSEDRGKLYHAFAISGWLKFSWNLLLSQFNTTSIKKTPVVTTLYHMFIVLWYNKTFGITEAI